MENLSELHIAVQNHELLRSISPAQWQKLNGEYAQKIAEIIDKHVKSIIKKNPRLALKVYSKAELEEYSLDEDSTDEEFLTRINKLFSTKLISPISIKRYWKNKLISNGIKRNCLIIFAYGGLKYENHSVPTNIIKIQQNDYSQLFNHITQNIEPSLKSIHGNFIENILNIVKNALDKGELNFKVEDVGIFRDFIRRTLVGVEKDILYATSQASKTYFWKKGNDTEKDLRDFVNKGGQMIRYFLIYKDETDYHLTKEESEIITRHYNLYGKPNSDGIYNKGKVLLTNISSLSVPTQNKVHKYFATVKSGKTSWELMLLGSNKINSVKATSNINIHHEYMARFKILESTIDTGATILLNDTLLQKITPKK
jgi:hypothetical protein